MDILETGPMSFAEDVPPTELAHQLVHPEGETGAATRWVDGVDPASDSLVLAWLDLRPGHSVLEVGFGDARLVSKIVEAAPGLSYTGLDVSPRLIAVASAAHAGLVDWGAASFHLGPADRMPFADAAFDRIVSVGMTPFQVSPAAMLAECRRVIRPGGLVLMGCPHPEAVPSFARAEIDVRFRPPADWDLLFRQAGFSRVEADPVEVCRGDETLGPRVVRVIARP